MSVLAAHVHHAVDGCLGEDGHLAGSKVPDDGAGAVLADHVCAGMATDGDDEIGGTRVKVWWEHAAGTEVEHGHCHALTDRGGEGGSIGVNDSSWSEGVLLVLGEVEDPVIVVREQLHAIQVGVGHAELSDEVWIGVFVDGIDRSHDCQGEQGEESEHHREDFPVESTTGLLLSGLLGSEI